MPALLATIAWLSLCWTLSAHWAANVQYSFGWLVPPLAVVLLWNRWPTRPPPGASFRGARGVLMGLAALYAPVWFVAQPNPEWRLADWTLALVVTGALLSGVAMAGGRTWLRHFAFPCLFILTAIPWPGMVEQPIVQGLMHVVAGLAADVLNLAGIAANAQGSLIQLKTGAVGVDEACSGVRSLQASLMAALFLGELYRLSVGRRAGLVAAGVVLAFLCNVGRATFLASRVAVEGNEALARYHDPAGYTILTACFALIWLTGWLLARKQPGVASAEEAGMGHRFPRALAWGLAAWMALTIGGAEWWFRHGSPARPPALAVAFPKGAADFREVPLRPAMLAQLQPDVGRAAAWSSAAGQWLAFSFQWFPGTGRGRILARLHKPDQCLPSTGWQMMEERAPVVFDFDKARLPFRALTFGRNTDHGDEFAHVYFCIWQEHADGQPEPADDDLRRTSLRLVWRRERGLGQQILEVVLVGPADGATADTAFRAQMEAMLQYREL
jgi:exosortase